MLKRFGRSANPEKENQKKSFEFNVNITKINDYRSICYCIEIFFLTYWINLLRATHAHYIIYLMCAGGAFCSLGMRICRTENKEIGVWDNWKLILAGLFGFFIVFGNYEIMSELMGIHRLITAVTLYCSSVIVFYNIFEVIYKLFTKIWSQNDCLITQKEKIVLFLTSCVALATTDLTYLFVAVYPGVLTPDSISQLTQIQNGIYSNHHPFYHTMIIKFFYSIGMRVFNDVNAAVATYSVFQICLMVLTFSYVVLTLFEISKSKFVAYCVMIFYAVLPYHWNYSCTMWKDIIFAITSTIFVVSLYRTRKLIGNELLNNTLVFVSSIGFCLFRSNGVFAFFITLVCLIFAFWNKQRRLLFIIATAFMMAIVMKGPVLRVMNVKTPDAIEALSIPAQQIARVIYNGQYIEDNDMELLRKIVDINAVKEQYKPYISDPVKGLVRQSSGNDVISNNKLDYLALWLRLGLRYPGTYIAAWVEQTRGYWNAGYDYWFCSLSVVDNTLGVNRIVKSEKLFEFTKKVIKYFGSNSFLCVFVSIGFCFWIYLVLFWVNLSSKRDGWIETIPFIAIIISLCVATPVFNEFRYSYALYSSLPFVIFSSFIEK